MNTFIHLDEKDNVITALKDFAIGNALIIKDNKITITDNITKGHKIAIKNIIKGETIIKYGSNIGVATCSIKIGQHVHTHNTKTLLNDISEYSFDQKIEKLTTKIEGKKVNVYLRKNGDVGIRNELWIIPTVGCANGISKTIVKRFLKNHNNLEVDGVYTFTHPYGCSQMGEDHENTLIALQSISKHPNAGGVLVLGLGCENNQIKTFKEALGDYDSDRIKFLSSQDVEDEIETGLTILDNLYDIAKNDKRESLPISRVKFGLECGGSDGLSGITANPLLGLFSDYVISYGGTSVLTEVPEMFGAETILMNRAKDKEVYNKIVEMINHFKNYYKKHDQVIYENPSPGNKKGGITTLEEKSLGCTQKAGKSTVIDVLRYGQQLKKSGLNLIYSPGNDLVATTALGIAGCNLVLFTTGRGTPFGGFIPTVKISTNDELAKKKKHWIDFNAGKIVEGTSIDELLPQFIDFLVEVINGKEVNNEINDFREIAIFKSGVTL